MSTAQHPSGGAASEEDASDVRTAWFTEGEGSHTSPLNTIDNPAKFVVCGPHNGFFQYAIWGPVSADVADVDITVDADGTRLTIQIGSP